MKKLFEALGRLLKNVYAPTTEHLVREASESFDKLHNFFILAITGFLFHKWPSHEFLWLWLILIFLFVRFFYGLIVGYLFTIVSINKKLTFIADHLDKQKERERY
jgi:hypothetical protein